MDLAELADRLAAASDAERAALLASHAELATPALAWALKDLYFATNTSNPKIAAAAATALAALESASDHPEIHAVRAWIDGLAALQIEGQIERAIDRIDEAAGRFEALGQTQAAAATQVSKIYALAMLGRYDEAIECGTRARDAFLAFGDILQTGKIELNLGNIYRRRDQYAEAEQFYRSARARFEAAGDQRLLAYANNDLANVLSMQHDFRAAEQLYVQALAHVEANGLEVNRADIECNLGLLEIFRGHYDRALAYLEQSRRRYAELGMPHESAIAEHELAEAYLELNLAPEAAAICERVAATFANLGMRAEQARALLNHAHARQYLGQLDEARALLAEARQLYADEGNSLGTALVQLAEAQIAYAEHDYPAVEAAAAAAEDTIAAAGTWGRLLLARWLRGEAARALGRRQAAEALLASTLRDTEQQRVPAVAQRCYTSLGLLAAEAGDGESAATAFKRAIELIETMRLPLPADEFRAAYAADKLTPYTELARIFLARPDQTAQALDYVERQRSRALVDMLGGAVQLPALPRDTAEARLIARHGELREELNWLYSQINRRDESGMPRSRAAMEELHQAARERESQLTEINRQIQQSGGSAARVESLDIARLQSDLGPDTALIEYFALADELLAFVITDERVVAVRQLASSREIAAALEQLRFQIGTLRYGAQRLRAHLDQLGERTRHYLARFYDMLLRPLERQIDDRRIVVVPHRGLHYVPFHALYDGAGYVIERREVCYAPSAGMLQRCLARPRNPIERALLLGHPDEYIPRVRDEVQAIAPLFERPEMFLDEQATLAAFRAHAPAADVIHLACHGQFRADSPLFSALHFADGSLTARDAYEMRFECELVTLSACESGLSAVSSGDDLAGLARGFFTAGAPSLLVSLWTVDDEATAEHMAHFYRGLRAGERPGAALRNAQRAMLTRHAHPFFWSAFALFGRW